jgi:hypothetical protein
MDFKTGDLGITPLKASSAEVLAVRNSMPTCPARAICDPAAIIKVQFTLNGCMDRLGPVIHFKKYNQNTHKYDVYISAFNINNEEGLKVLCKEMPTKSIKLYFGMGFISPSDIKLIFLKTRKVNNRPLPKPRPGMCLKKPTVFCAPGFKVSKDVNGCFKCRKL